MPPSPECKSLADTVADLASQEEAKLTAIASLTDVAKWTAMEELGTLRQQRAEQQALLDACEKQHLDDLSITVAVTDLPKTSNDNRIVRVWQLTPAGQSVKQTIAVRSGVATVSAIPGARQSVGITVEEVDHPNVCGPDFRSGPLPPPPTASSTDPASRVEIVILDPITITAESLAQAAPALPIHLSYPGGSLGTIGITVSALEFSIANGALSLGANGTASAVGMTSPFSFSRTLHLAPTFGMARSTVLDATSGDTANLSMPGIVGAAIQLLSNFLSSNLLDRTLVPLRTLLNRIIVNQVAATLGLRALPSGSVVSVRELAIDNEMFTITPALAAFGTVLSDFQPSFLDAVRQLISLDVQPSLVTTSNSATRIAQGTIVLDAAAPAGGAVIVLSCDRADYVQIESSVTVPEGSTSGTFAISGTGNVLMSPTNVDATIKASLGNVSLTAALSIQPESPTTPTSAPANSSTSALTGSETSQLKTDMLAAFNRHRATLGWPPLTASETIAGPARAHSIDMASGKIPQGYDGFENRGVYLELVASGNYTPDQLVQLWLNDPSSGKLIDNPAYTTVGVGVAKSAGGIPYITMDFK